MGILDGKRILITGVLTDSSIAFSVARTAQLEGAEVVLTGAGRGLGLTRRTSKRLPVPAEVIELDVRSPEHLDALEGELRSRWPSIDGVLHAIAFAPADCLGESFMKPAWPDVADALHVSAYSLKALAEATVGLMHEHGGSIVGLDFDARFAWPGYNWMGVAKAALESTARYLARDLGPSGVRVNLVAAGPVATVAARSIPGFKDGTSQWDDWAPLGWDPTTADGIARTCVALFSDWLPMTTAEIIHVDGGYHAMGRLGDFPPRAAAVVGNGSAERSPGLAR